MFGGIAGRGRRYGMVRAGAQPQLAGAKEKDRRRAYGTQLRDPALRPGHHCAGRITPTEAGLEGFTLVTKPRRPQRRAPGLLRVTHKLGYAQSVDRPQGANRLSVATEKSPLLACSVTRCPSGRLVHLFVRERADNMITVGHHGQCLRRHHSVWLATAAAICGTTHKTVKRILEAAERASTGVEVKREGSSSGPKR